MSSLGDDELSPQDLAAQTRNAFALILAKLGRRDHTEKELERAIARKGYAEEAARAALKKARREGLVNDERAEITDGVAQDEQVVLAPESSLTDGTRVEPERIEPPSGSPE